jgi:hypothetical protein
MLFNAHDLYSDTCGEYKYCAIENEAFNFIEVSDAAYGTEGKFAYLYNQIGTIVFDNKTFGDPAPGQPKLGFYKKHIDSEIKV